MTTNLPTALSVTCDWADVSRRLTLFALQRLGRRGSIDEAKDMAQEAIRRFLDPSYAGWDRNKEPSLLRHLGSIVNGVISTAQQRTMRRGASIDLDAVPEPPSQDNPASKVELTNFVDHCLSLLRERLCGDALAQQVLELQLEGLEKAREQAHELAVSIDEIYKARRRLAGHLAAIRAAQAEASDHE